MPPTDDLYEDCPACQAFDHNVGRKIHSWLDGLSEAFAPKIMHQWNDEIVEFARMWGDDYSKSAELHIINVLGKVPTRKELEFWELMGPPGVPEDGRTFLTDWTHKDIEGRPLKDDLGGSIYTKFCSTKMHEAVKKVDALWGCQLRHHSVFKSELSFFNPAVGIIRRTLNLRIER
jgi:hypothetical protein